MAMKKDTHGVRGRRPARGPGRPAAVDGDTDGGGPRERLLDAATLLFSRHGVAGTPIKAIAAEAGVTPALVHYYFRDRDQLLDAVVDERLQPLVEQVFPSMPPETGAAASGAAPARGPGPDVVTMMTGLAAQLIRVAAATPWLPGLWIREIVGAEGQLRERVVQRIALRRGALVTGVIAAARERGELNPALEPALVMVSLIGLTLLPLATTHIWRGLPGAEAIDTDTLVRHVSALLSRGLAPG
ncbi:TetR/AcrR family transcriptional regulator [Cupriavidus plantarum]|uniref:TetR/AcrR family transcriptional regulator n=1 Tax=Cupriavidus plantarum TaxID=942865 RepID=UPI000E3AC506|nr:TetR/AcrR family transcriptional regulator [Cupriavidus plantarum]REE92200.1 TetR family transcriptional regulator [Cupriavidus plantarum]RLK35747.1 TetR family transcriptional regulator [Cupriavidus plantarum]